MTDEQLFYETLKQFQDESYNNEDTSETKESLLLLLIILWRQKGKDYFDTLPNTVTGILDDDFKLPLPNQSESFNQYREQFSEVLDGYKDRIQSGKEDGKELEDFDYQTDRIDETESKRIEQLSAIEVAKDINEYAEKNGVTIDIEKTWRAHLDRNTCPMCASLNGMVTNIYDAFIVDGQEFDFDEFHFTYDYYDSYSANAHPNCRCTIEIKYITK